MPRFDAVVTMLDAGGNTASFNLSVNAVDQAAAITAIQGAVEAANDPSPAGVGAVPLTVGKVQSVSLSVPLNISTWNLRANAAGDAENQKGGRFIFMTEGGYTMRVTLPTFNDTDLKLNTGYIDTNNPAVFSFYSTALLGGGFSDYRGDDLGSLKSAYATYGGRPAFK